MVNTAGEVDRSSADWPDGPCSTSFDIQRVEIVSSARAKVGESREHACSDGAAACFVPRKCRAIDQQRADTGSSQRAGSRRPRRARADDDRIVNGRGGHA